MKASWVIVTVLAVSIAVYAQLVLLIPEFGPAFLAEHRAHVPFALRVHIAGVLIALALGPRIARL
jgi:hypothetical protein